MSTLKALSGKKKGGIHIKPSRVGSLHAAMGVSPKEKLSTSSLESAKARAEKSGNTKLLKKTVFALNARKWNH